MALREFNINGRKMAVIENRGFVDYDNYYIICGKSFERREKIVSKYEEIQSTDLGKDEPRISLSTQYSNYLDALKTNDVEMFNKKRSLSKQFSNELYEEELVYLDEIKELLSDGYSFDAELKRYGFYVVNIDSNYYQYTKDFELIPISIEQLKEIKYKVSKKKEILEHQVSNKHHSR